ncbi:pentatricopeptide repeat-containing protein At2g39620-like [Vicia villosa]|uniref:pentatricopeptide repeat-containing protein At2g39620-like n=1 Tax=Vicia villosa TaxID=3911 RepID=UPI00273B75CB|nr:pentatricopeptide repeat-containing protein At2g39620-like [Vicia villosa]XP_058765226.1 pentatricopeptide repeat-containing protein At2g39620-like [Vicia villosa]XP_058765227.1 pentatricopeptide repeat-containing protein At2g39620-like [Vicia villosa]XP_058765229.1 pentatricopeptide repeat-containing protein At2g39620-like [Vicia villosa]
MRLRTIITFTLKHSNSLHTHSLAILQHHHNNNYLKLVRSCKHLNPLHQLYAHFLVSGLFHQSNSSQSTYPSLILCNSLIRLYSTLHHFHKAIHLYHTMLQIGLQPDKYTFTFVLKACTAALDFHEGVSVYRDVAAKGLECDVFIGTSLVNMFCKMGRLDSARKVFDKMLKKDAASWNVMISGLSQSLNPSEALEMFRKMQMEGLEPDTVSILNLAPAISRLEDIGSCKSIHGYVVRRGICGVVSNSLIDMYSKCGEIRLARRVFDRMRVIDDVSLATMMAGYVHHGCYFEVLELFDKIKHRNVKMNKVAIVNALLAAAEMRDLEKGKEIHNCALQIGIMSDIVVATPVVSMYAKCGELKKAKELFLSLEGRDLVAWSSFLSALVQAGYPGEALSIFQEMQHKGLKLDKVILTILVSTCVEISNLRLGKTLHCYAIKADMESDISTVTTLVSMYTRFELFMHAMRLFNRVQNKDVVVWNALINGFVKYGDPYLALEIFHRLQSSGIQPDSGTLVGMVSACSIMDALDLGTYFHGNIKKRGLESDTHVKVALMDMYAKCGSLFSAKCLFLLTKHVKDEVSWNVMISGYLHNGYANEAISTFQRMKLENILPNLVTFAIILPAVSYLTVLKEAMAFHACIIRMGFLSSTLLGNSLVDMYAKCGQLSYSEKCFHEMENKDTISWNAMLSGYAMHGQGELAVALFSLMQETNVHVDSISYISVLSACRHAGLIQEGKNIFASMCEKHHVESNMEHYACMVDLLCGAGLFDEALSLINKIPTEPDAQVWGALLGGCKIHSNITLGEVALDHLVKLEPRNAAHYVVLSDIYAQCGKWNEARRTRSHMNAHGLKKIPGYSWIGAHKQGSCLSC